MRILVLVADYPRQDGYIQLMYVHVRNKYYLQNNIDVTVLNFKAENNYVIDGIPVITLNEYKNNLKEKYDILVCHAPNIRNHYMFLRKFQKEFSKIVFFFHGHEVVRLNKVYPKPYVYQKKIYTFKSLVQDIYDIFKLVIWNNYFPKLAYKSHFVFVSKSMYKDFLYWTKIKSDIIEGKYSIIYNSVGEIFEMNIYKPKEKKVYDYITIRNNLDSSVYCIDIVNALAKKYPNKKFLIIGKGKYFDYNEKSKNIILIKQNIQHEDMLKYIDKSKCALMPTRRDTQGVMSCELATYGIPLITSDIPICHEVFCDFDNVAYMDNKNLDFDLNNKVKKLIDKLPISTKHNYYQSNTCSKEVELLKHLLT